MKMYVKNYELNHDGQFVRDRVGGFVGFRSELSGVLYNIDDVDRGSLELAEFLGEKRLGDVRVEFVVIEHRIDGYVHYDGSDWTVEDVEVDGVLIDPDERSEFYELACDVLAEEYANDYVVV